MLSALGLSPADFNLNLNAATIRHHLSQILNFGLVLSTAFMLWKGLSVVTDSPSPIVVVLSGSMEPAFQRGDLLFLWNRGFPGEIDHDATIAAAGVATGGDVELGEVGVGDGMVAKSKGLVGALISDRRHRETQVGEIVVYNVRGKDIPIVHRVVRRFGGGDKPLKLLTKGDNNAADDTELYARGQAHLTRSSDVIGSVVGYVPYVGYVTILLSEYPWLKTVLLLAMGLSVILQRE